MEPERQGVRIPSSLMFTFQRDGSKAPKKDVSGESNW